MPSVEASLANLEIARVRHRPWRPWRSAKESWVIRHLVWQWFIFRGPKWSERMLARRLGVHHHYVQKLEREFRSNPRKIWKEVRESGYRVATFEQLEEAREHTRRMAQRNELRPLYRSIVRELERDSAIRTGNPEWVAKRMADGLLFPPLRRRVREERKMIWPSLPVPQEIPPWATSEYSMLLANSG